MSLKKNIGANYISRLYVTLVGILLLPLYIEYMGVEAYGLIGFFTMLQSLFGLFDLGLTPTIGRETARYKGGAMSALSYRQLFRALSLIFIIIAFLGAGGLLLSSSYIATRWLNVENLMLTDVILAVQIMSISVSLRWMCGLYRGVVVGSEELVWLSSFNALIATLRFVVVFIVMWFQGFSVTVFFTYQLVVALLEFIILFLKVQSFFSYKNKLDQPIGWSFKPVKSVLKFALIIAFTSSIYILFTQVDKLVLSGILSLDEYGYFTIAVLVASGIMVISGPISNAIMPRMTRLYAEGKKEKLIQIYRKSTQLVCIVAGSASITLSVCAEELLFAWTGNLILSAHAAPILQLYAIGNGFLVVAAFPYYLQYAKGNLRYHLIGNAGLVVILIPSVIFAANYYGGIGAGYVWLSFNVLFLFTWVAYVHYKLEPGLHVKWLFDDVLKIILPAMILPVLVSSMDLDLKSRIENILYVIGVGGLAIISATACSKYARLIIKNRMVHFRLNAGGDI